MKTNEYHLHKQVIQYIKLKYPLVIFRSDLGGIKLTIGQATKNKAIQMDAPGYPDLFIAKARLGYHGLFLELKTSKEEIYTKEGKLRENRHISRQMEILSELRKQGYWTDFICSFEDAVTILDWYLQGTDRSHPPPMFLPLD